MKTKPKNKIPQLWWDFACIDGRAVVIVESDNPRYPVVAKFNVTDAYATLQIELAEKMIADIRAGRLSLKNADMV